MNCLSFYFRFGILMLENVLRFVLSDVINLLKSVNCVSFIVFCIGMCVIRLLYFVVGCYRFS